MDLRYSHIDILVRDLDSAVTYFEQVLGFESGPLQVWERGDTNVRFRVLSNPWQRFIVVEPHGGSLKALLDEKGDGTIYRFCFSTPDLIAAHRELLQRGIHPIDENGRQITERELTSPAGPSILWLPPAVGSLSIEFLEEPVELPT